MSTGHELHSGHTRGQHNIPDHHHGQESSVIQAGRTPLANGQHEAHQGDDRNAYERDHRGAHEGRSVKGFRKRFWRALVIILPILLLSPMLQAWAGLGDVLRFPGDVYLLFAFTSLIFFYGGYPFLNGFPGEIQAAKPGKMTLISVAISTAFVYSTLIVFGLKGEVFF